MLGARFFQVLIRTMLRLLSSPTDNARSMVLSRIGKYDAPSVDFLVKMLGAWFNQVLVSTMLRLLSFPSDNAWSMVLSSIGKYQALAVVIA